MNKTLNFRYLIRLLVVVSVVVVAIWLVHRAQAAKVVDAFRIQAKRAEEKQDFGKAAGYLRRLLVLDPSDTKAQAQMVLLLQEVVRTQQQRKNLFLEMEEVLREDPNRDEVRRRVIDVAIGLGLYSDAQQHIDVLVKRVPDKDKGKLYDLKGRSLVAAGQFEKAIKEFETAANSKPSFVLAYGRLATLYRRQLNKPADADKIIKQMLDKDTNKESASAHLVAAYYYKDVEKPKEFKEHVNLAFKYDPTNSEAILAKTEILAKQADPNGDGNDLAKIKQPLEEACKLLNIGIEKHLPGVSKDIQKIPWDQREDFMRDRALAAAMFEQLIKFRLRLNDVAAAKNAAITSVAKFPEIPGFEILLADVYIASNDWKNAGAELDKAEKAKADGTLIALRRGKLAIGQENWTDAARLLEKVAADPKASPALKRDVQAMLGQSYDRMGMFDRSADAYRQSLPMDRSSKLWLPTSMRLAATLVKSGRPEDAKAIYEAIVAQRFGPQNKLHYTAANIPLARLLLSELFQPQADKNKIMNRIASLLAEVDKNDVGRNLIEVSLLANQGKMNQAHEQLKRACDNPALQPAEAAELWTTRALLQQGPQRQIEANKILDETEKRLGNKFAVLRLARAQIILGDKKPEKKGVADLLKQLELGSDEFSRVERQKLLNGLARLAQSAKAYDVADHFLSKLADETPDYLPYRLLQFDNAVQAKNESHVGKITSEIKKLDPNFMGRFVDVLRTISAAQRQQGAVDRESLKTALETLTSLERERPTWSRIPLAQATIHDLQSRQPEAAKRDVQGDEFAAMRKYVQAIKLGERGESVLVRAFDLCFKFNQHADAKTVVSASPQGSNLESLFHLALALNEKQFSIAIRYSEDEVKQARENKSKDLYQKLCKLNQIYLLSNTIAGKEQSFIEPTKVSPTEPQAWVLLVQYYVALKPPEKAKAEAVIEESKKKVAPANLQAVLAPSYAILGDDRASGAYEQWLKDEPNDLNALVGFAKYLLGKGDLDRAADLAKSIRTISKSDADKNFADQVLVLASVTNKDYQQSRGALRISGAVDQDGNVIPVRRGDTEEDIRTRALALGLQRDPNRKLDAIKLLNEFRRQNGSLSEQNRLLLAQLDIILQRLAESRALMSELVNIEPTNVIYRSLYADVLIKLRATEEAEAQVAQLEKLQPDSFRTTELRARLLAARDGAEAAGNYLVGQAAKPKASILPIANLMEKIGAGASAKALYEELAAKDEKPKTLLDLAQYYGRQNRIPDAMNICDRVWNAATPTKDRAMVCGAFDRALRRA